jgi:glutamine synthetase
MSDPQATLEQIRDEGVQTVDFRFTDLRGRWQHIGFAAGGITAAQL